MLAEVSKLLAAGVWDSKPVSQAHAVKMHPDATFSLLFHILGIKDWESATAKYKARVFLQGSNVKDDSGNHVYFNDTSSAPTNMTCIRSVVSYGQLSGGGSSQADAEQAFIQPPLDDSVHMYVFIPKELRSPDMQRACVGIEKPVFRLRRPLYGWSRSGNIWEHHLADTLKSIHNPMTPGSSWQVVDSWPQFFWKIGSKGFPVSLCR